MNNRKGFSLVQLMIVAGMLSGIFVVSLKIMKNQNQMGRSSSEEFEIIYLFDDIRNQLSDRKVCLETFNKVNLDVPSELEGIASLDDGVEFSVQTFASSGLFYGQNNVKIQSIRYQIGDQESSVDDGEVFLEIDFKKSKSALGSPIVSKKLKIHLELDSMRKLVSCYALGGVNLKVTNKEEKVDKWESIAGTQDIYTDVKQVQINTSKGSRRASLVLGGRLLLGEDKEACTEAKIGTLRLNELRLEVCNKAKSWHAIWWPTQGTTVKEFDLASKKRDHIIETKESFNFCSISEVSLYGARCNVQRLSGNLWRLALLYDRGDASVCKIKCFK
jgi:hypothetical protein